MALRENLSVSIVFHDGTQRNLLVDDRAAAELLMRDIAARRTAPTIFRHRDCYFEPHRVQWWCLWIDHEYD